MAFHGLCARHALRSGYLEDQAVTAKDLMVQPNPPRFLREGDTSNSRSKSPTNLTQPQTGTVRLTFNDALTETADNAGR